MDDPKMTATSTYDEVPYASYPYVQTHPDRLATVATLFGMEAPDPARCRVLELGCASGGNLIPMAVALPDASFVGIDLSERQIAEGREVVSSLGLTNIELRSVDIADVDATFGEFDCVIAHGVYSWVPTLVQRRILELCAERLTDNGLAYISYNTYPGWHLRGMIRDMMLYHAAKFQDPQTRVRQSRALLDFLAKSATQQQSAYAMQLKGELELLRGLQDSYLFHEHLEEHNEALYFHEFIGRAESHGLVYVGEAQVGSMAALNFPAEVQDTLRRVSGDRIQAEQYMDFLRNRTFRQTILSRARPGRTPRLVIERISSLHVASAAKPQEGGGDPATQEEQRFLGPKGSSLTTRKPLLKGALTYLSGEWPRWVTFEGMLDAARELARSRSPLPDDAASLTQEIFRCFLADLVELHSTSPPFVIEPAERPKASPLARYQAGRQERVTTLRHELIRLGDPPRFALQLLDGTRDRDAVIASVLEATRSGGSPARADEAPTELHRKVEVAIDGMLGEFARSALLAE